MRKLILKIHAYLGLLCVPFLLIIGISSLDFNHEFSFLRNENTHSEVWNSSIAVPDTLNNESFALALNDSLDLMGWYIPWDARRDSVSFSYKTVHFGSDYNIHYAFRNQRASVTSVKKPVGEIIKGLHFLGEEIPNAPARINSWQYYMDISVYSLFFWVITGIYLWITKKTDKVWGAYVLIGMVIISILFLLFLWLAG